MPAYKRQLIFREILPTENSVQLQPQRLDSSAPKCTGTSNRGFSLLDPNLGYANNVRTFDETIAL
jgi:hypothetical protein